MKVEDRGVVCNLSQPPEFERVEINAQVAKIILRIDTDPGISGLGVSAICTGVAMPSGNLASIVRMRPLFTFAALLVFLSVPVSASADRVADASSGRSPRPGDMVLFPMDDISIPWRDNLKLTLQAPKKYPGNPVMRMGPSEAPDGNGALAYGTVIKQEGKFRMWYIATPRADSRIPGYVEGKSTMGSDAARPIAYAESADGIHWNKPNLGLVVFRGSKDNNLVLIEPADDPYSLAHDFVAVLYDPEDPDPDWRYKMAYIVYDQPSGSWPSTATAVSRDGLRWKLVNTQAFTKGPFENTSLIKFDQLYYVAGQDGGGHDGGLADGSRAGRVMKVFFSPDFRHWSNGRALGFYRADYLPKPAGLGQEVHMGAGLWNRGNVILGFYGRWHGDTMTKDPKTGTLTGLKIDLGLVISNDAVHYREPVRNFVAVSHGHDGDWDSEAVLQSNAFANTDAETYIWYTNWDTSQPDAVPPLPLPLSDRMMQKAYGVGLLTLPRDRFGYFSKLLPVSQERNPAYDANRDASCLTRSLTLAAPAELSANVADVSRDSRLLIALVDDAENPLAGYTSELDAESLEAPVTWKGGQKDLPAKTPFRIKVTWPVGVDQAKLYALYIEPR